MPFVFAVVVVMPLALYPVYRVTAVDPSLAAYWQHYLALPFWPNGPMWFLWQLLALTIVAAAAASLRARIGSSLSAGWSSSRRHAPGRYFVGLATVSAVAYVPLALAFTPWTWSNTDRSRSSSAARCFMRSTFSPARDRRLWPRARPAGARGTAGAALGASGLRLRSRRSLLWMGLTAPGDARTRQRPARPAGRRRHQLRAGLRERLLFRRWRSACGSPRHARGIFDSLADNAFGMYLFHYVFVVWLQYALLGVALFAIAKAAIVFGGTLLLAWAMIAPCAACPLGSRLIGAERGIAGARRRAETLALESRYASDRQGPRRQHRALANLERPARSNASCL